MHTKNQAKPTYKIEETQESNMQNQESFYCLRPQQFHLLILWNCLIFSDLEIGREKMEERERERERENEWNKWGELN